jgi:hypothetical protein
LCEDIFREALGRIASLGVFCDFENKLADVDRIHERSSIRTLTFDLARRNAGGRTN